MSEEKLKRKKSSIGTYLIVIALIAGATTAIILVSVNLSESTKSITITGTVGSVDRKFPLENGDIRWAITMQDEASMDIYKVVVETAGDVMISIGTRISITGTRVNAALSPFEVSATSYTIL